ncbi:MAG TPA: hypothetical protein DDW51_17770, partial [Cyanobacteria bacterium UBA11367]|nr:hypothetical protein [Cyanobacteria bacterium UBA11367]
RSPFSQCKCRWGCECDRPFHNVNAGGDESAIACFFYGILKSDRLPKSKCDRAFWYVSAGGDGSAIALFRMQVLVGMGVRSYL